MSCPSGKATQTCDQHGSSGVIRATANKTFIEDGFHWRLIDGDPQPGRVYWLIGRKNRRETRKAVLFRITERYDGAKHYTLASHGNTGMVADWYERVENPEPEWLAEPAPPDPAVLEGIMTDLVNPVPQEFTPGLSRVDTTSGGFVILWHSIEKKACLAVPFDRYGRRVAGAACAARAPLPALKWLRKRLNKMRYSPNSNLSEDTKLKRSNEQGESLVAQLISSIRTGDDRAMIEYALRNGEKVAPETILKFPDLVAKYGLD